MFAYSDPVGTSVLNDQGAQLEYRSLLHALYKSTGEIPRSGFVPLEAFEGQNGNQLTRTTVSWLAFPKSVPGTLDEIDADRLGKQDEYVEWRVERSQAGIRRIVFTTEFPEYYEALAAKGLTAL